MTVQRLEESVAALQAQVQAGQPVVLADIDHLLDETITELARGSLKQRPIAGCEALQNVVEFGSTLVKRLTPEQATDEQRANLKAKVTSAKCGGLVSAAYFIAHADFAQFVEKSFLHNKLMTLHMQLPATGAGEACIPIGHFVTNREGQVTDSGTDNIPWSELVREELGDGHAWFRRNVNRAIPERPLFITNADGALRDDHSFNHWGIIAYDIKNPELILPYDQRNPAEWGGRHILEMWTYMVDKSGCVSQPCLGDHSYMVLRNGDTGDLTGIGNFAKGFTAFDMITPLAHKRMCLETPDRYHYCPKGNHSVQKRDIVLTRERYNAVLARFRGDKSNPDLIFGAAKHNCTTWCGNVAREELGIELHSKMMVPEYMLRLLPDWQWKLSLIAGIKSFVNLFPEWMQNALYFFPLIYIPCLIFTLCAKLLSLGNCNGETDFELLDIFFFPWRIWVDSPLIMRQTLDAMTDEQLVPRPPHGGEMQFETPPGTLTTEQRV